MANQVIIRDVQVGAGAIPVIEFGEGERPLVIIPGVSLFPLAPSASSIHARYDFACSDYRIFVLDRRLDTAQGCTVETLADEAAEAVEALGVRDACVLGTSMGGMMAQVAAARYPHLVSKLALASTVMHTSERARSSIASWSSMAAARDYAALAESFAEQVYSADYSRKNARAFARLFSKATPEDFARFEACTRAAGSFDGRSLAHGIKAPTKVFAGEGDQVFPLVETSALAADLGAPLQVYPGAPHALYDEEESFPRDLVEFFGA